MHLQLLVLIYTPFEQHIQYIARALIVFWGGGFFKALTISGHKSLVATSPKSEQRAHHPSAYDEIGTTPKAMF